jgi:hypothetical protein
LVHFPLCPARAASAGGPFSGAAALRASPGEIGEAFFREKLLFPGAEVEFGAAVLAGQGLIFKFHMTASFLRKLLLELHRLCSALHERRSMNGLTREGRILLQYLLCGIGHIFNQIPSAVD